MARATSPAGRRMIASFEGCRLESYRCAAGKWTVGYGRATADIRPGMVITQAQAEAFLDEDLKRFEDGVNRLVKVPLSQNQFDALVSFAFNLGLRTLENSTLLKMLNAGRYSAAAEQMARFCHSGGQVLPGLVRRRAAERDLFLTGA